ncbi:unnamed protein product [Acanthoscelides obtectus]|uniref:Tryptophan--tRNA ligase n=1 Tax=Acanthoscelides obtectus TaxID=200917 RepID=A0A9P0NZA3_ACAOB|nr:unnamed protein product [Acanthoscelides obtectus]CAK1663410.1 Tryptophan--tRNA ligase, mitochondrial [Acanthoscelides obtectus]
MLKKIPPLFSKKYLHKWFSTQANHVKSKEYPKRIFSGIQPTGAIHLGNYLGAISQWVKMQNNNEDIILSVVDLHSMTLPHVNISMNY